MNIKSIRIKYYINIYENRKIIYKENRKKSGVYYFFNNINNKFYIGSSINLTSRLYTYFSRPSLRKKLIKNNSIIFRAILKYGYSNFEFGILKYCPENEVLK